MIGKLRLLFWLGIVMLFLPFFGIPNTWKMILAILIGSTIIAVSTLLRNGYRTQRMIIRNLEQTVTSYTFQPPAIQDAAILEEKTETIAHE